MEFLNWVSAHGVGIFFFFIFFGSMFMAAIVRIVEVICFAITGKRFSQPKEDLDLD